MNVERVRTVVQIAAAAASADADNPELVVPELFALADDGSVWLWSGQATGSEQEPAWFPVPALPKAVR